MYRHILITGGAGFIGSHLADLCLENGDHVRVLDNLTPQVHGPAGRVPDYLDPKVEFVRGDVGDAALIRHVLEGVDCVCHLAAAVGVGQSMYEIARYVSANNLATAVLLEALAEKPVERLLVASSMSIYGEGLYRSSEGKQIRGHERSLAQLHRAQWELLDERDRPLTPVPTPEDKPPGLASIYALSKFDQERMCLLMGRAYHIPTVALRFFNVYGPRQSLSNPYAGAMAIFAARLLNDNPPLIYEDGKQRRDFVNVHDVVQSCYLALEAPAAAGRVFNIGSGQNISILELAQRLAEALGKHIEPEIVGRYRVGDIRHCFADINRARGVLGYEPQVSLDAGLEELVQWLRSQSPQDKAEQAIAELKARGLTL